MRILDWAAKLFAAGTVATILLVPTLAHAGRSCEEQPISLTTLQKALGTAQIVQAKLNESGSDIALIGRIGKDLSQYHLRYSHVGIAFRDSHDQAWQVMELLNQCGTADSDLWADGLGNFFLDDVFSFDSIVLIPPPDIRQRLMDRLHDQAQLLKFHEKKYNMLAYSFSTKYQNSNQWVLENLAVAESTVTPISTREQAQTWLQSAAYVPSELKLGPLTRLGGRMFKVNIAFDDHPNELRFSNRIQVVTVDSIIDFLRKRNEGWQMIEIAGAQN